MNKRLRDMCYIALMAAVICVLSPFTINVGPIPISLCSFTMYLAGAVLGLKRGTAACCIYLLLGAVGVPVFANFTAGFAKFAGPTGGYLVGYIPCAALTGLGVDLWGKKSIKGFKWAYPVSMLAGTVVLYVLGTAWFIIEAGSTLSKAMAACVLPFLAGDAIKIVVATAICPVIRERVFKK